jgi:hypothetical protein
MWKGKELIAHCAVVICYFFVFPLLMTTSAADFTIFLPEISSQEISFNATLSGVTTTNCPDNRCYLQGTLRSVASSKYFGETANASGGWVDYVSSPDTEYIKANYYAADIQGGSWFARLKMRFKIDDPNYQGPGDYELKLRRYTGKSSNYSAESNTLSVSITAPGPTTTPTPTCTPTPANTPTQTPLPTSTPASTNTPTPTKKATPTLIPPEIPESSDSSDATSDGVVLGDTTNNPENSSEDSSASGGLLRVFAVATAFIAAGLALLSGVLVWQKRNPNG